jgi:hypothetical protein
MPYWMTNPDHGTMPVYDMGEVERVKKFGWTLLNVGESPLKVRIGVFEQAADAGEKRDEFSFVEAPEIVALPVVSEPPKRKPGRPPKAK